MRAPENLSAAASLAARESVAAREHLAGLPASEAKEALLWMADYAVQRRH